jgi:hypothetical protein
MGEIFVVAVSIVGGGLLMPSSMRRRGTAVSNLFDLRRLNISPSGRRYTESCIEGFSITNFKKNSNLVFLLNLISEALLTSLFFR